MNTIQGEFPICNIIMTQKASGKLELIEMEEDQVLQLKYMSTPITKFWKFVPESKYPELKRLLVELFQYSEQCTCVNHSIPH